ncbi:MAG: OmpP1/FadL family transporter [Kofleriaceae bacterium]
MKSGMALGAGLFVVCSAGAAHAGGLYLPGAGAISTSRAGAAVASTDSGEALAVNTAGLAKTEGTTITLSAAIIDYAMTFQRRGTYDQIDGIDLPWEGQPYPLVEDNAKPPLGLGSFQPIPVIAVTTDLGGAVPNLRLAVGMYAPNSYPFRDLCTRQGGTCRPYDIDDDPSIAPNPARYDVQKRTAALFTPTLAASYRILPNLDVGARFGWGFANLESTIHLWAAPNNLVEDPGGDGRLTVKAKDNFVPTYGAGITYRPTTTIEIGGSFNGPTSISAKGTAAAVLGPRAGGTGIDVEVVPRPDEVARCAPGGRVGALKACIDLELPMSATIGARYKFLGPDDAEKGDVELNVGWEDWGGGATSDYEVKIDSEIRIVGTEAGVEIKPNLVRHGYKDVFNARLGGSWKFPVGTNTIIARGGVAYDTAAATKGWYRADVDGAARLTTTIGAGFRASRFEINAGFGYVFESASDNEGECNPTSSLVDARGCNMDGVERPLDQREGPDPINPIVNPDQQREAPVTHGVYESHYIMFMLGASTWF